MGRCVVRGDSVIRALSDISWALFRYSDVDTDDSEDEDSDDESNTYAFPTLDAQIRQVISSYGAVFPKLNFSSPKV